MRELSDDAGVARTGRARSVEIDSRSCTCGRRVAQPAAELPSLFWRFQRRTYDWKGQKTAIPVTVQVLGAPEE
jgi:hypothetical protein